MKISGRSLKRRVQLLGNRLSRIKHHNGHGVHSPFVYGFVRKVLMAKSLQEGTGSALFEALRGVGLSEKRARELHNAMCYAEAQSFAVNSVDATRQAIEGAGHPHLHRHQWLGVERMG